MSKPDIFEDVNQDEPDSPIMSTAFSASERQESFTFWSQSPSATLSSLSSPRELNISNPRELKRAKGHPDAPTPSNSPQKKRVHTAADMTIDAPPPLLFQSVKQDFTHVDRNALTATPIVSPPQLSPKPESSPASDVFNNDSDQSTTRRDGTLMSFWKPETAEEKRQRNHRDFEELSRTREKRELEDARTKALRADRTRIRNKQRQQAHRTAVCDIKISNGWKPNQKRVCFPLFVYERQRLMELLKKYLEDFDESSSTHHDAVVAELSRPRHQYKEDRRATRKPQGRKRTRGPSQCKYTNWQSPFLWSQIEIAVVRAGKPWSPREITRQAQKLDPVWLRKSVLRIFTG